MKLDIAVLASMIAACAPFPQAHEIGVDASTFDEAQRHVADDIALLSAIELFHIGDLIVTEQMMPGTCDGACPDDAEREARYVEQANRLRALLRLALEAEGPPCDDAWTPLEDIADLKIVEVGSLVIAYPDTGGLAYTHPNYDSLLEEANAENAEIRSQVCDLAQRASEL